MIDNVRVIVPGDKKTTLEFAVAHWLNSAKEAISHHGAFYVALSGGSTPKAIYEALSAHKDLDWGKVHLFWSDERNVPLTDKESNYHMAMEAGFKKLPLKHVYPMDPQKKPEEYEATLREVLGMSPFDLIMLGMGEDGHTASLFPGTKALQEQKKWIVMNEVPQKNTSRITMTIPCLNNAKQTVFYVLGKEKKEKLTALLEGKEKAPATSIGTKVHPALWIVDL